MRILFWNILHGGGSRRTPEIALALLEWAPDVIVLCEFRTTLGGQLRGVLSDHAWEHQLCTDPPEGCNGIMVASRTPVGRIEQVGVGVGQRLIGVRLIEKGITLLAAHVPPLEAQDGEAQAVWKSLLDAARGHAAGATLVIGDLNAGRRWQDEAGVSGAKRLFKDAPVLQRVGTESMGRLWLMGYRDAWRHARPRPNTSDSTGVSGGAAVDQLGAKSSAGREFSWYSHEGRGVRIDHVLASASLIERIRGAHYEHAVRESGISDHAAIVVEISPGA